MLKVSTAFIFDKMLVFSETETKDTHQFSKEEYWSCWKLKTRNGRQTWEFDLPQGLQSQTDAAEFIREMAKAFDFDKAANPNSGDKIYRMQALKNFQELSRKQITLPHNIVHSLKKEAFIAALSGLHFYQSLQAEEGHWPGDYGGPLFLLPGLVIASYVTETPFAPPHCALMKRYMLNHQNDDGGWGLHIEGKSTMFGTVMQYVALRLLGMEENEPSVAAARGWILKNGGATGIPSWGKFYLAVLGVFNWEGCNSLLPEMWLLPSSLPVHPGRYWCHSRMVYLPMAYCYGNKVKGKITPLIKQLQRELFTEDYLSIRWKDVRNRIAPTDSFTPPSAILKTLNAFINLYERFYSKTLRKKALDFILEYINAEDEQTDYVDIGPVNQAINSICVWHAYGKNSAQFQKHVERWKDYLWVTEDGMKMNGYNGSQLWDTAFAVQAVTEGGLENFYPETIKKAYHYIDITQVQEDVPKRRRFFRHISKGGWPFSTLEHGWPISDCTAEGLSAVLKVHRTALFKNSSIKISDTRLFDAVNIILSLQNKDGGWATYEQTRGMPWLELLNPSEVFSNIMIDYSYTECTAACIRALCEFQKAYPYHRREETAGAISRGAEFIKSKQLADGSWLGSWGVCFTYGTWFAMEGLITAAENPESLCIQRACDFLRSKQNEDGGWGESYESCVQKKYIPHKQSQVVNTSWALLALMAANYPDRQLVDKGIRFLIQRQQTDGDWQQQGISGVFNSNCMITYTAYRNVFPLWALGRYYNNYGR